MPPRYKPEEESFLRSEPLLDISPRDWKHIRDKFNAAFGSNRTIEGLRWKYFAIQYQTSRLKRQSMPTSPSRRHRRRVPITPPSTQTIPVPVDENREIVG